jgi:hypothetical protein
VEERRVKYSDKEGDVEKVKRIKESSRKIRSGKMGSRGGKRSKVVKRERYKIGRDKKYIEGGRVRKIGEEIKLE